GGRDHQTGVLIDHLKAAGQIPWVLVGDFNDWNKKVSPRIEKELDAMEAFKHLHGKYPPTFPSLAPMLSLDRVFLHNVNPVSAETLRGKKWKRLSDHLPLLVEFEI